MNQEIDERTNVSIDEALNGGVGHPSLCLVVAVVARLFVFV